MKAIAGSILTVLAFAVLAIGPTRLEIDDIDTGDGSVLAQEIDDIDTGDGSLLAQEIDDIDTGDGSLA